MQGGPEKRKPIYTYIMSIISGTALAFITIPCKGIVLLYYSTQILKKHQNSDWKLQHYFHFKLRALLSGLIRQS